MAEQAAKTRMALTPEAIRAIEDIIHRRNQAEIKVERGEIVVVEISRKRKI